MFVTGWKRRILINLPKQPAVRKTSSSLGPKATKRFVLIFLALALGVALVAVQIVHKLNSDPEMMEQLQDVHEQATTGDSPADSTSR